MKKKGFTLIELLAVIVILAIIALIATPIIMNVIENSRKGAAERSAENHLSAIETAVMEARLDGTILADGTYSLAELEADDKLGTLEVSGQKATDAFIIIENGQVLDGSTLEINNYVVNIIDGVGKVGDFGTVLDLFETEETEVIEFIRKQSETIPTITYNPITGEKGCDLDPDNNCFGWYVLEDKGEDYAYVSLLMDRNLGETVAWLNAADSKGAVAPYRPVTALNYLKSITNDWKVKANIPTGYQIANVGDPNWTPDRNNYGSNNYFSSTWLVSNMSGDGSPRYWTSTPKTNNTGYAITVSSTKPDEIGDTAGNRGVLNNMHRFSAVYVRPVITISKEALN